MPEDDAVEMVNLIYIRSGLPLTRVQVFDRVYDLFASGLSKEQVLTRFGIKE